MHSRTPTAPNKHTAYLCTYQVFSCPFLGEGWLNCVYLLSDKFGHRSGHLAPGGGGTVHQSALLTSPLGNGALPGRIVPHGCGRGSRAPSGASLPPHAAKIPFPSVRQQRVGGAACWGQVGVIIVKGQKATFPVQCSSPTLRVPVSLLCGAGGGHLRKPQYNRPSLL